MSYRDDLTAARAKIEVLDAMQEVVETVMSVPPVPAPTPEQPETNRGSDEARAAVKELVEEMTERRPVTSRTVPPMHLPADVGRCATCNVGLVGSSAHRVPVLGVFARFIVCPVCKTVEHRLL